MAGINMPGKPEGQLEGLMKALSIAQSVYGIKTDMARLKSFEQQQASDLKKSALAEQESQLAQQATKANIARTEKETALLGQQDPMKQAQMQANLDKTKAEIKKINNDIYAKNKEIVANPTGKKPTQAEFAAAGFAKRAMLAEDALKTLPESQGTGTFDNVPMFEAWKSGERKTYENAKNNFISAILRKESGAAISESEFDMAEKTYFPQPGDSAEQVANKALLRQQNIATLQAEGANAIPLIKDVQVAKKQDKSILKELSPIKSAIASEKNKKYEKESNDLLKSLGIGL